MNEEADWRMPPTLIDPSRRGGGHARGGSGCYNNARLILLALRPTVCRHPPRALLFRKAPCIARSVFSLHTDGRPVRGCRPLTWP
jgi:hypothetical protein